MIERANETAFDWAVYEDSASIATQWYFLGQSEMPVAIQGWILAPGQAEGGHTHPIDSPLEEFYLVVSGEAEVHIEGTISRLGVGDAMLAKVGVHHDIRNPGSAPLRLVMIWGKPGEVDWSAYRMGRRAVESRTEASSSVW